MLLSSTTYFVFYAILVSFYLLICYRITAAYSAELWNAWGHIYKVPPSLEREREFIEL